MAPISPNPETRKRHVFRVVVREYVETAEPVGSETIVGKYDLGVSSATIRNDMAELEERGYLEQPHTSAGRIPTDLGYRFYVNEFVRAQQVLAARQRQALEEYRQALARNAEAQLRQFAHTLAHMAKETVVVSFNGNQYCIGISNLVAKPEFQNTPALLAATQAFDNFDRIAAELSKRADSGISVLIGKDGPFGASLASVVTRVVSPDVGEGFIGIVGPTRMDYDTNVALLTYVHKLLSSR